jgi:hypothetical protein
MAIFECLCCDFSTPKKDNYTAHLTSKKHLKNAESNNTPSVNIVHPMPNGVQNNELLQIIRDLEAELKLKNEIIKMKDDVIDTLKHQLSHIPQKPQEQPKTKPTHTKVPIIDTLNEEHNAAVTIEDFYESYFKDENYNKYIKNVDGCGFTYIYKSIKAEDYISNSATSIVDLICSAVNVLPVNKRPFFCSDKKRCHFYVNTRNKGWVDCEDKKQLDNYLVYLIKYSASATQSASGYIVNKLTNDQFIQTYGVNKDMYINSKNFGFSEMNTKWSVTNDTCNIILKHLKRELCEFTNKNNSSYKLSSAPFIDDDVSSLSSNSETDDESNKKMKKRKEDYLKSMN